MALSLISSATTSFAGAAALPNPIRTIAEPIAAIGIVGFDKRAMCTNQLARTWLEQTRSTGFLHHVLSY